MMSLDADHFISLFEQLEEGVVVAKSEDHLSFKILFKNQAASHFFSEQILSLEEIQRYFVAEDLPRYQRTLTASIQSKESRKMQLRLQNKSVDSELWVELQIIPKKEGEGLLVSLFIRDINDEIQSESLLKQSELKHRLLFTRANDAIFIIKNLQIVECNEKTLSMFESPGYSGVSNKMLYLFMPEIQYDGSDSILNFHYLVQAALEGEPQFFYWIFKKFNRTQFEAEVSLSAFVLGDEHFVQVIVRDITARRKAEQEELRAQIAEKANRELQRQIKERIQAEEQLKFAQQYNSSIINSSLDMIVASNKEGVVTEFNLAAVKAFGCDPQEIIGQSVAVLFASEEESRSVLLEILEAGYFLGEIHCRARNGDEFTAYLSASMLLNKEGKSIGTVGVVKDITELKEQEAALKESVAQKEVLIKEVHHRVKNNLQVINSILQLQTAYIDDEHAIMALQDCQSRIKSMAFIHESLYQSSDLAKVNFSEYLEALCKNLLYSYQADNRRVRLKLNVDVVSLSLDTVISCGLIVNELISNAFKHAFPAKEKGEITVDLTPHGKAHRLIVNDNGVGMPAGLNFKKSNSLGLQLVLGLVDQIDGKITKESKGGTKFIINFKRH